MKKIMVVDDEPDVRSSIKQALEYYSPDYEVICIENGNMCFEMLRRNEIPDLIILDIMMPGMSGWMLIDRLRENASWKEIPVIFLTARWDKFAENLGKKLGNDYIKKPFDIENLKKRIDKVLKKMDLENV
jgi:DNA-binding response OmpR family regulator